MTDQHPNLLFGAYVLGSLSAAERHDVDLHVRDCPHCAADLAELVPLRAVLASVDAADIETLDVEPSPDLFERITATVDADGTPSTEAHVLHVRPIGSASRNGRRRPSRPRILVAAAVAAVALAGAGVGIGTLVSSGASPGPSFSVAAGSVRMDAQLEPAKTGTTLHVTVAGLPINEHCTLIAVAKDGSRHSAGQWVASYGGKAQITTATDFDHDQLRQLILLGTNGQTLITMPIDSGK